MPKPVPNERPPKMSETSESLFVGRLTTRASAAATAWLGHYPTFLRPEASVSCMRLLGRRLIRAARAAQ
jgi:hypothetical protein